MILLIDRFSGSTFDKAKKFIFIQFTRSTVSGVSVVTFINGQLSSIEEMYVFGASFTSNLHKRSTGCNGKPKIILMSKNGNLDCCKELMELCFQEMSLQRN